MGVQATYIIPWLQTEVDGLQAASVDSVAIGSNWRALVAPLYLFGNDHSAPCEISRRAAAKSIEKLIGGALDLTPAPPLCDQLPQSSFALTNGKDLHIASLLVGEHGLLMMFQGPPPQKEQDYWVTSCNLQGRAPQAAIEAGKGVICFAQGTFLRSPFGSKPIEAFRPGDLLQTKDNGVKPVLWSGKREMSGARLHVMPHLRPIRFHAGALGQGRPDQELLVSPHHRMLVTGPVARDLFGSDEILVSAKDLVDGKDVQLAYALRSVTYHHLLLEEHQIVFANGLASESFHPAMADFASLTAHDQQNLLYLLPKVAQRPDLYGQHARRSLNPAEVSILNYQLRA